MGPELRGWSHFGLGGMGGLVGLVGLVGKVGVVGRGLDWPKHYCQLLA